MAYKRKVKRMARGVALRCKPGEVYYTRIEHDNGCDFWRGGECDCNPTITMTRLPDPSDPLDL